MSNTTQTLALLSNCLRSAEVAGDSCPHLYDEAEALCIDLLVEVRRLRAERDQRKEVKTRGQIMERQDAADTRPTLEDHAHVVVGED